MGAFNTIPPNPYPPSSDQQGNGSGSQYELPIASAETLGGVKVGTGLSIDAETGALSNPNPTPYSLPTAGAETLGGVKVGTGLSIDAETGVLSNNNPTQYTPPAYSTSEVNTGEKWIDGKDIFRKVFSSVGQVSLISSDWTNVAQLSGAETVINIVVITTDNTMMDGRTRWNYSNGNIRGASNSNMTYEIDFIIVEYTKATT